VNPKLCYRARELIANAAGGPLLESWLCCRPSWLRFSPSRPFASPSQPF